MSKLIEGKIIRIISNLYTVKTNDKEIDCHARGKFRNDKIVPLVGDICKIDEDNKYIMEILPRINYLDRPSIANVDIALIVTSVKLPNLSLNLLDKLISIITINNIEPVLVFTKLDLLEDSEKEDINNIISYYKKINYQVFINTEIDKIKKYLKDKQVVVTGQTGAGKSSLLNKLNENLLLKTDEISTALGRGKHTTRHTEIFAFDNLYIADTPGFSSIDFNNISKEEIRDSFKEFNDFSCKYRDCFHDKENDCSIKKLVLNKEILKSRYENYLEFIKNK